MAEQTTQMSLTRALTVAKNLREEIKVYFSEKRTIFGIQLGTSGERTHIPVTNVEKLKSITQSDFDTIKNKIDRLTKIKQEIANSNNRTKVIINGKEMTISEAINLKGTLPEREYLLKNLKLHQHNVLKNIADFTVELDKKVEDIISASIDEKNTTPEAIMAIRKRIREEQYNIFEPKLVDNMNVEKFIIDLEEEIRVIKEDLDVTLSISNTNTMIEV